ncbi:MAG: transaldolase family protein [Victivallales bacterium]
MNESLMKLTSKTATGFWNDSCDLEQLREALEHGAVGATSNPVIVSAVIKSAPGLWNPVIDRLILAHPTATEDDVAWKLIAELGGRAAKLLMPEFRRSGGTGGRLSLQVNPKYFRDAAAMVAQAEELNGVTPNVAIKMPVVPAALLAIEEATSKGIVVTPTVCFSVSQAVAAAEAVERGLDRAKKAGIDICPMRPNVAIMVGRLDDHLKRVMESEKISIDPGCLEWAGVAVFKRAYQIFRKRGFRSVLLAAAYRNHMQWSEFIGGEVNVSIPYSWWKRFNASNIEVKSRIDTPVHTEIISLLEANFPDFRRAYEPDGMSPEEFISFGATVHTLKQFISAYHDLLALIRERMIR